MKKMMIQVTSGKGPAECCRVVACVQSLMMKQAKLQGIELQVLENKAGELNGTLLSATMMAVGDKLDAFVKEWAGTVQWIAQSPYRKYHKRKNWFVGVAAFDVKELMQWNSKDVKLETLPLIRSRWAECKQGRNCSSGHTFAVGIASDGDGYPVAIGKQKALFGPAGSQNTGLAN
jgi:hypothetical protein